MSINDRSKKLARALDFTKFSVFLLICWPPPKTASKIKKFVFELSWWFTFVSSVCLLLPLTASIYAYRTNTETMTKSICLACAVSQTTIKIFFCRLRREKLQYVLGEMENFLNNADPFERKVLENYVGKCSSLHLSVVSWSYMTSVSFILLPFFMNQKFPTDAVYPFSLEHPFVRVIVYAHQSIVGLQTSAAVLLDSLIATLLWFVCARFEISALSVKKCKNHEDLRRYIKDYQSLLRYTEDVKNTVDLLVMATITTSIGGVLFSLIQLISDQSYFIKGQFAIVATTAVVGLYTSSWAADNLLEKEYLIGIKAFHSNWWMMEKKSQSCILHVITQSQMPIKIKASRMLPTLSMTFFSQFLSTSFRIFAALKVMME